ncbi:MAG: hypothetical protein JRG97_00875 [Deltaproteobacteria bacterium]|nr:hypothetical protein [Deltaproteobacteria bacterium]MBW2052546.1 hypothetical protein [Deltaproteobacteria bacterium]MBW2139609.1 hypothetical protein [Deltaproteobacteria bacterium]MBW2323243.1 hypothetical protein [Deltaproteobacteria bacterium]
MRLFGSIFFSVLVLIFGLNVAFVHPEPAWAGQTSDPTAELTALKAEFIKQMSSEDDPEEIMALAAYYTARTWEIAARRMAERYQNRRVREYIERIDRSNFEKAMEKADLDPVRRQILSLRLLYKSASAVAGILALKQGDKVTLEQLRAFENHLNLSSEAREDTMKAMVSLTKGIMTMMTLSLRSVDVNQRFLSRVNKELESRVQEANAIDAREDIHFYAKLFLWAVNNINGCFRFVYFLNLAMDQTLAAEVDPIFIAWEKHSRGNGSPIRTMALGLTAVAEASFPLAAAFVKR